MPLSKFVQLFVLKVILVEVKGCTDVNFRHLERLFHMYWHICYCFLIFSEAGLQFLLGYIFGDIFHRDREIRGTDRLFLDFGLLALLSFLQDEE